MTDEIHSSTFGRRGFLKVSGAALGGALAGSTVVAAESTDRFIVKKKGNSSLDVEVVYDMPEIGYAIATGTEKEMKRATGVHKFAPDVELDFVQPPTKAESYEGEPEDDEFYGYQWDKQDLNVPTAHETTKGAGTRIAIIDSGIDATHPDLEVNLDLSRDFTDDGLGPGVPGGGDHGTHVAGIAGAETTGTTGVAGIAPAAELVDFRVFSNYGGTNGSFAIVVAAMLEAARTNCDVANLSLGAYPVDRRGIGSFYGGFLNKAMTHANSEGTLLVCSAGNDAADLQHDNGNQVDVDGDGELETLQGGHWISLPNEGAKAFSVAATGPVGYGYEFFAGEELDEPPETPAQYTNYGTNAIDIAAPGGNYRISEKYLEPLDGVPAYAYDLVFSTVPGGYGWKAGTSMAAPNVAGAAALVKSANPDYNANQVRSALQNAASVPGGEEKAYYGAGYLNIVDAL